MPVVSFVMSATNSTPSSAPGPQGPQGPGRAKFIENRRRNSAVWQVVHLLGSLGLALVLLAVLAIACAVATFYESSFSAAIARHYIYQAPWFLAWLGLLCVNLFAVTLTRWPWEKKHFGFVLTHYGIILLLLGAVVGSRWGFEGNVTLHRERPAVTRVTTSRSVLQIEDPNSHSYLLRPFDAAVTRPKPGRPVVLPVPGTKWRIEVLEETEHVVREVVLRESVSGRPGVILEMESVTAGQRMRLPFFMGEGGTTRQSLGGMAGLALVGELPALERRVLRENRLVLARFAPVRQGDECALGVELSEDGRTLRVIPPGGGATTYRLDEVLGGEFPVVAGTKLSVREYWPDFEMRDGRPASAGEEPNNPAVLIGIEEERAMAGEDTGGDFSEGLQAVMTVEEDGNAVGVRFLRQGALEGEARLEAGQSVATGWNDWRMTLVEAGRAVETGEAVRAAREGMIAEETGIPGFLARLRTPEAVGEPVWVESGRVTPLDAGSARLRIGYGLQTEPLPFAIRLVSFEVPRFEGTMTPANFIATVEFRDLVSGEVRQEVARMNKPAIWPAGWGPLLTGLNYKFSQAEWNPQDLDETTLQVLHDPGWMLKWIGSLGICAGIGLMFYWKPKT